MALGGVVSCILLWACRVLNIVTVFFLPIVADFCTHLFSKGVSFCVAIVSTFAAYPFVSLCNCKF